MCGVGGLPRGGCGRPGASAVAGAGGRRRCGRPGASAVAAAGAASLRSSRVFHNTFAGAERQAWSLLGAGQHLVTTLAQAHSRRCCETRTRTRQAARAGDPAHSFSSVPWQRVAANRTRQTTSGTQEPSLDLLTHARQVLHPRMLPRLHVLDHCHAPVLEDGHDEAVARRGHARDPMRARSRSAHTASPTRIRRCSAVVASDGSRPSSSTSCLRHSRNCRSACARRPARA